jgi:hypothetical protein
MNTFRTLSKIFFICAILCIGLFNVVEIYIPGIGRIIAIDKSEFIGLLKSIGRHFGRNEKPDDNNQKDTATVVVDTQSRTPPKEIPETKREDPPPEPILLGSDTMSIFLKDEMKTGALEEHLEFYHNDKLIATLDVNNEKEVMTKKVIIPQDSEYTLHVVNRYTIYQYYTPSRYVWRGNITLHPKRGYTYDFIINNENFAMHEQKT